MRKYFDKPKKDRKAPETSEQDEGLGNITEGASGLSISEKTTTSSLHHQQKKKTAIPRHVSQDEAEVRRSPRIIAKRARSLVDEVR